MAQRGRLRAGSAGGIVQPCDPGGTKHPRGPELGAQPLARRAGRGSFVIVPPVALSLACPQIWAMRHSLPLALILALVAAPPSQALAAEARGDWALCRQAIAAVEGRTSVPPGLLNAIGLVETGRRDPRTGRLEPWPWSYNVEGESHAAPSKAAAMAEVAALQDRGIRSIDVGCMQVNLLHHPTAFRSLDEAFDPRANLRYAAQFLQELRARNGDWGMAIARYHSGEAVRGAAYSRRVALARLGAAWGGGGGTVPLPPQTVADICAPGLRPALLFGGVREARRLMTPEARRAAGAARLPRASDRPRLVCLRPEGGGRGAARRQHVPGRETRP